MNLLRDLPLWTSEDDGVHMVVETPRGSDLKLKYHEHSETFRWSRPLISGLTFPYDFGFLPQTLAEDGDAVDAMLITDVSSYPGVVCAARIIGSLKIEQNRDGAQKRNDRIMLLPVHEHRGGHVTGVTDLAVRLRAEIEAFYSASLLLTGKHTTCLGWGDAMEAREGVTLAAKRYADQEGA